MMLKKMDRDEIEGIARHAVRDAIDFAESEISDRRIKNQRYFDGEVDIGYEDGTSKIVKTVVRDTVRAIKPSLMRVFLSTDKPVEFVPRGPEDVQMAEQATEFLSYTFNANDGYRVINDAFHDALIKMTGVVKCYWETQETTETHDLSDLNDMEFTMIVNEEGVEVIEHEASTSIQQDQMGQPIEVTTHRVKVARKVEEGRIRIESVPPEEFFVDREARTIDDLYCCAHRTEKRVGDLVEMGFDFDEVVKLSGLGHGDSITDTEEYERRGFDDDHSDEVSADPSMRLVAVTECYMEIDVDGTGIPQLHRLFLAGNENKLLEYEAVGYHPFAVFEIDPEPHTFYGRSIPDLIINDQDASTSFLRGILNNVALTNNPRKRYVDGWVEVEDLLNNEIGALVKVTQLGAVEDEVVPFMAGSTLPAMEYMDRQVEEKTGVTKASSGLSADALQNQTATAVAATVSANAAQIEVMARNLAEGGMKQLFKLMLKVMVENVTDTQMMRLSGDRFVPVDPRSWNTEMDVCVNVGLGTGQEEQKAVALNQAFQVQSQIMQTYGLGNGLVSLTNLRNTLADMLALSGIRNAERYFAPMDQQMEQQLLQAQQQQSQQQGPDPQTQAFLQAEQYKADKKADTEIQKAQIGAQKDMAGLQLQLRELAMSDDLKRDELDQQLLIKAAEILGRYGATVDTAQIKSLQAAPRI